MSSRIPGGTAWHEGLSPEELDQETALSRVHHLSKADRRAVIVFALCCGAILALGIATVTMVRVAPTPGATRISDIDTSIERAMPAVRLNK